MDDDAAIEEEYRVWAKNAPFLYDVAFSTGLEWPSLTVEWLPGSTVAEEKGWERHQAVVGTHTSDGSTNQLMLMTVDMPGAATEIDTREDFGKDTSEVVLALDHPGGEVNKARHMPQRPTWIATKCADSTVLIYDLEKAAEEDDGGPVMTCEGHDDEGFGLGWDPRRAGRLLSGSNDGSICAWDLVSPNASEKPIVKIHKAHGGSAVGDVSFCPRNDGSFASVGDDHCLRLWDLRASTEKCTASVVAHDDDGTCVAYPDFRDDESGYLGFLLATGSADSTVKLWDTRNLSKPIHVTAESRGEIITIQWAPFAETVLAASGWDRKVRVYDYSQVGKQKEEDPEKPPELIVEHSGHRAKINDFSWNPNEEFLAASVSADNSLQFWWVSSDVYDDSNNNETSSAAAADNDAEDYYDFLEQKLAAAAASTTPSPATRADAATALNANETEALSSAREDDAEAAPQAKRAKLSSTDEPPAVTNNENKDVNEGEEEEKKLPRKTDPF